MKGLWNTGPVVDPSAIGITGGNTPIVLCKMATPFVHISSASIGNNGALTGVTTLVAYANAFCYFPANAIAAGVAAGWYLTQFSSTTAGTIFNNAPVLTSVGAPMVPASPTPFVTTGPGAFTGDTTEQPAITLTIPILGKSSLIRARSVWLSTNNVDVKTSRIRYSGNSGTAFLNQTMGSVVRIHEETFIQNQGSTAAQYGWSGGVNSNGAILTPGVNTSTVDSSVATSLVASVNKATATDNHVLEQLIVELMTDGT